MVRVCEHGTPRDHVDGRGGDHGEGVVAGNVRDRRRRALAVQARQGLEARPRRGAELVPVREAALRAGPVAHHGQGGRVRDHHFRVGPLHHPLDFLGGEPPVDGIRDHALAGARRVQVDVGHVVLGEDADAIASGETQPPQPGGQRIRPLQQLPEGPLLCPLDQRGSVAVERGAPPHHVVDREGLGAHPPSRRHPSSTYDFFFPASLTCFCTTPVYALNHSVTFTSLPPLTCQICTSPPPSWSVGVTLSGGTSPPRVKFEIFSKPAFTSVPVIVPPALALRALRMASTWNAAMSTPRV